MLTQLAITAIGLVAGKVINYLADVLPMHHYLANPPCPHCGESYAALNDWLGLYRCGSCRRLRGLRMIVVEILAAAFALLLWNSSALQMQLGFILGLFLLIYFGVIVVIDIERGLILHPVSLFGGIFGFVLGTYLHGLRTTILGGVVGFGLMLVLYYLGELFTRLIAKIQGEKLNEKALGFGDVNLTGVLGLILGWPNILIGIFLAIMAGGIFSMLYLVRMILTRRYHSVTVIPYGPFLVFGAFLSLYLPANFVRPFAQQLLVNISTLFAISP